MKDSGGIVKEKEKEFKFGQTIQNMKANGLKIKQVGMVKIH